MSTFMAKPATVTRRWLVIDATDQVVGRLAVQIANILRGKHRPEYTPHVDTGEFVIVVNAEKVRFTGKKLDTKTYQWYTRYPGGFKQVKARDVLARHPDRILREAVKRMVPRNPLGRQQMTKLKIYAGPTHPHQAQLPQEFKLKVLMENANVADTKTKKTFYLGTGRRKTAVARVRLSEGSGQITINGRSLEDYFTEDKDRNAVVGPLEVTEMRNRLDLTATVMGGGFTGQAGAVCQGVARGLKRMFGLDTRRPEGADGEDHVTAMEKKLRDSHFLTRDGRMKERKKYGRKGARKSFQFSKRDRRFVGRRTPDAGGGALPAAGTPQSHPDQ